MVVMSSTTWMLHHALPLPGPRLLLLPKLSFFYAATSLFLRTRPSAPRSFPATARSSGVSSCLAFRFASNPRASEVVAVLSGGRLLSCAASSSSASNSAMAGACSDPPPMYRANVGVCLINDKNQVFVAQRLDVPGAWQMPQGGIDGEEEPRAAAFRELREETGVTSAEYLGEVPEWLTYDFPPEVKSRLTSLWGTEWNGQAQKWFLFKFTGNESEINLLGDGSENPEFSEWKWVPVEDVIKNAVEFKKQVYERAFKHLVKLMS